MTRLPSARAAHPIASLHFARGGARAIARWWSVRQTIRALSAVDDATLRDIGIARSDIEGAARRGHL